MNRIITVLVALLTAILIAPPVQAEFPSAASPKVQSERAKKVRTKISCGKPSRSSHVVKGGVHTFRLEHGDVGKCSSDAKASYSQSGTKHMERIEIRGGDLRQGGRYLFSAEFYLPEQFKSAHKSTIFQIHQWDDKLCKCGPYVMIMIDKNQHLNALVLVRDHDHKLYRLGSVKRSTFAEKWVEIAIDIDTRPGSNRVAIFVGGQRVLNAPVLVQKGGKVFPKAGLYRHAYEGRRNPTDQVHMRNLRVSKLK